MVDRIETRGTESTLVEPTVPVVGADRAIRWGPIVAGLMTALSMFILLSLLALGAGLAATGPGDTPPTAVATVVTSLIALFSFFLGGFVAAWSAAAVIPARGVLYGFLVWATWLVLMLVLSGLGLGTLFGEVGAVLGGVRGPDLSPEEVLDALSTGAFGSFLALALAALSAMLGGVVGTNDELYGRFARR